MRRRPHDLALARVSRTAPWIALGLATLGGGCSSASSDLSSQPGCLGSLADCEPSFGADVVPKVFAVSCALAECHGSPSAPQAGLYLGPSIHDTADATPPTQPTYPAEGPTLSKIRESLLAPSAIAPTMPRVDPGKPETSFLMHKLDGDFADAGVACAPVDASISGCGRSMPQVGDPLPAHRIELVRAWIARGAKSN